MVRQQVHGKNKCCFIPTMEYSKNRERAVARNNADDSTGLGKPAARGLRMDPAGAAGAGAQ